MNGLILSTLEMPLLLLKGEQGKKRKSHLLLTKVIFEHKLNIKRYKVYIKDHKPTKTKKK
jgi:hypothetical protein